MAPWCEALPNEWEWRLADASGATTTTWKLVVLHSLGGDIERLKMLLRDGPEEQDRLVGVILNHGSCVTTVAAEPFIRYEEVQIV
jgi:hypothetical protein